MKERFVSEGLQPVGEGVDLAAMARGEPGLPEAFHWRGGRLEVAQVLESWKETGSCKSGKERYLRRHW